jgi:hypothetical protein
MGYELRANGIPMICASDTTASSLALVETKLPLTGSLRFIFGKRTVED